MRNIDQRVVEGFGREWQAFDHANASEGELRDLFEAYFAVFPWAALPARAIGFDLGCGTGRWARFVAPRVGHLYCIDPSQALEVARKRLAGCSNVTFHEAAVDAIPLPAGSMDFGYSLGVLHHVPDTAAGIASCASLLKPGAPLLLYLYYDFEDRPYWFRLLWSVSDLARRVISRLPFVLRRLVTDVIAAVVYWPLARLARVRERLGSSPENMPLAAYRARRFYQMRTDALDRFGTRLEQRFSRLAITRMCEAAGLVNIRFSAEAPYWCVVGFKPASRDEAPPV
jgi:SAM-dependent methyltransferase